MKEENNGAIMTKFVELSWIYASWKGINRERISFGLTEETEMLRNLLRYSNNWMSLRSNVNVKVISELLREFNGVDSYFSEWEKQICLLGRTYELDDNMAKILICSKLKGKAMQWFPILNQITLKWVWISYYRKYR